MPNDDACHDVFDDALLLEALAGALKVGQVLEAQTNRSLATQAIKVASTYVVGAANDLAASKFSRTAIDRFRGKILNALKGSADELAALGWYAGGQEGAPPPEIVGDYMAGQGAYLSDWLKQIADAKTLVGGAYRAQMYAQSLEQVYQRAYMRAKGDAVGVPDLPAYPRDGSTRCRTNCHCAWVNIKQISDIEWNATWRIRPGENCEDCLRRSRKWAPLRIVARSGKWRFQDADGKTIKVKESDLNDVEGDVTGMSALAEPPRRFWLQRDTDVSGVSGTGLVAEGVQFSDGRCAMEWRIDVRAIGLYADIGEIEQVHGHDGKTRVVWIDEGVDVVDGAGDGTEGLPA